MQLTFVNEQGASFSIEIDPNMELENVIALLASDTGLPESETLILYNGRALSNPKATMVQLGVPDNAMLLVGRRSTFMQAQSQQQPSQDLETMRLSILGNPELLQRLQGVCLPLNSPSIPSRFTRFKGNTRL
ncbi:hypothetical protein CYLTODRAFT_187164 [Cylindrobasidium torrendii FP15055 ss-10]|uniref:Ubiquitin-like domain-containing protein n=1 Tax=Cylindrobasidium torrendii FP15055 ss-10 TaxID=1314674 RepID=A0A0D7BL88_9AGAR|nr:hypothetical protein CYLTODRAFT_187164 [Cylindrobasidium torrendii FP15055 ss-10]